MELQKQSKCLRTVCIKRESKHAHVYHFCLYKPRNVYASNSTELTLPQPEALLGSSSLGRCLQTMMLTGPLSELYST